MDKIIEQDDIAKIFVPGTRFHGPCFQKLGMVPIFGMPWLIFNEFEKVFESLAPGVDALCLTSRQTSHLRGVDI